MTFCLKYINSLCFLKHAFYFSILIDCKLTLICNFVPLLDTIVYLNALELLDVPDVIYKRS